MPHRRIERRRGKARSLRPARSSRRKNFSGWRCLVPRHDLGRSFDPAFARVGENQPGRAGAAVKPPARSSRFGPPLFAPRPATPLDRRGYLLAPPTKLAHAPETDHAKLANFFREPARHRWSSASRCGVGGNPRRSSSLLEPLAKSAVRPSRSRAARSSQKCSGKCSAKTSAAGAVENSADRAVNSRAKTGEQASALRQIVFSRSDAAATVCAAIKATSSARCKVIAAVGASARREASPAATRSAVAAASASREGSASARVEFRGTFHQKFPREQAGSEQSGSVANPCSIRDASRNIHKRRRARQSRSANLARRTSKSQRHNPRQGSRQRQSSRQRIRHRDRSLVRCSRPQLIFRRPHPESRPTLEIHSRETRRPQRPQRLAPPFRNRPRLHQRLPGRNSSVGNDKYVIEDSRKARSLKTNINFLLSTLDLQSKCCALRCEHLVKRLKRER